MKKITLFLSLVSLVCSPLALALDVNHFEPNQPVEKSLTQFGSTYLHQDEWDVGAVFDVSHQPLEFSTLQKNRSNEIIDWFISANAILGYGITDRIGVSVDVPTNIYSHVESIGSTTVTKDGSMGDIRLTIPANILNINGFGIGMTPFVSFTTGSSDDYFGNRGWNGSHIGAAGVRLTFDHQLTSRDYVVVNVGSKFRNEERLSTSVAVGNEVTFGGSYVHQFGSDRDMDLFVDAFGSSVYNQFFKSDITTPAEILVGARKRWKNTALVLGAGDALNDGYGTPSWRIFSGLTFYQRKRLSVPTSEPVVLAAIPTTTSLDVETVDEKYTPIVATIEVKNDQIVVASEKTQKLLTDVVFGRYQITATLDGYSSVKSIVTVSSTTPIRKNFILRKIAEVKKEIPVAARELAKLNSIFFYSAQDTLKPESVVELDKAVVIIKHHPEVGHISIEAHTDSQGPDQYNMDLSYRRAKRVFDYFTLNGIDKAKLSYIGYGETKPIDTNDTPQGRARNRRIDFIVSNTEELAPIATPNPK